MPPSNQPSPAPTTAPTFEDALARLQEMVTRLEGGALTLDETIAGFREATELAGLCQRMIAEAELRITELAESDEAGESPAASFTQVPF